MKLFAAIHVPEKFGSRPAFIDDFGLRQKMRRILQPLWWKRFHRERVAQRPFGEMARQRLQIHRMHRVAGQDVVFLLPNEVKAVMQA